MFQQRRREGDKMNIYFYGNVIEYTNSEKSYVIENCLSIRELIDNLGSHYGERFKEFLLGEETCFFLVNGKGIMMTGGLNTKIQSGDKIEVLPFAEAG
jgi:molybdopterin converting factor small subunit